MLEKRKPKPSSQELMDAAAAAAKEEAEAASELAAIGEAPEAEAPKKRRGKAAAE